MLFFLQNIQIQARGGLAFWHFGIRHNGSFPRQNPIPGRGGLAFWHFGIRHNGCFPRQNPIPRFLSLCD